MPKKESPRPQGLGDSRQPQSNRINDT